MTRWIGCLIILGAIGNLTRADNPGGPESSPGQENSLPALAAQLRSPDASIRLAAMKKLADSVSQVKAAEEKELSAYREKWGHYPDKDAYLERARVRKLSAKYVKIILAVAAALGDADDDVSGQAIKALHEIAVHLSGSRAARESIFALAQGLPLVQQKLRESVGDSLLRQMNKADLSAARAPLQAALKSPEPEVSRWAACALGFVSEPSSELTAVILDTLSAKQRWLRYGAWNALAEYRASAKDAVPVLVRILQDKETPSEEAIQVVEFLGRYGPEASAAIPALKEHLGDPKWHGVVAQALCRINPSPQEMIPLILEKLPEECDEYVGNASVEYVLAGFGKKSLPVLLEALKNSNGHRRLLVTNVLARLRSDMEPIVPELLKWARRPENQLSGLWREAFLFAMDFMSRVNRDMRPIVTGLLDWNEGPDGELRACSRTLIMALIIPPEHPTDYEPEEFMYDISSATTALFQRTDLHDLIKGDVNTLVSWLESKDEVLNQLGFSRWQELYLSSITALGRSELGAWGAELARGETNPHILASAHDRRVLTAVARIYPAAGNEVSLNDHHLFERATEEDHVLSFLGDAGGFEKEVCQYLKKLLEGGTARADEIAEQYFYQALHQLGTEEPHLARKAPFFQEARSLIPNLTQRLEKAVQGKQRQAAKPDQPKQAGQSTDAPGEEARRLLGMLSYIGADVGSVPVLRRCLKDKDLADQAAELLGELGLQAKPAAPRLQRLIVKGQWQLLPDLAKIDPPSARALVPTALERLTADLRQKTSADKDRIVVEKAMVLARWDERAVPVLIGHFVARRDFTALAEMGPLAREAVGFLAEQLGDEDNVERALDAILAIGSQARSPLAANALKKLLSDADPALRVRAALVLATIDPSIKDGIPILLEDLRAAESALMPRHDEEQRLFAQCMDEMMGKPDLEHEWQQKRAGGNGGIRRLLIAALTRVGAGNAEVAAALQKLQR